MTTAVQDDQSIIVPIDLLVPNPENPRTEFDPDELEELAGSIREIGVLEPLIVRELEDGTYMIIAGERRWRAAQLAPLETVPCRLRPDLEDSDRQQIAMIVENVQRVELSPLDRARGYQRLAELGLKQREIADRTGVSQTTVSKTLAVLKLPEKGQLWVQSGELSVEAASRLWALPAVERKEVLDELADEDMDARTLQAEVAYRERDVESFKLAEAKQKELQEGDVVVLASVTEARAGKAKPLHELHWVKAGPHRKLPCRAVVVEPGRGGEPPRVGEWCTKPKSHAKPKTEGAPAGTTKVSKSDEELARHLEELAVANARRKEWMVDAVPDVLGFLRSLVEELGDPDLCEQLGIPVPSGRGFDEYEAATGALLSHADTVETAIHVLWFDRMSRFEHLFETEGWGAPKALNAFAIHERQRERGQEFLQELQALGYQPSWVELKRAGMPYEVPGLCGDCGKPTIVLPCPHCAEGTEGPTETGAAAPIPPSTDAEGAPDQTADGTEASTEDTDEDEPSGGVVVKVMFDRDTSKRPHGVSCSEHGFITSQPTPSTALLRATGHLKSQHGDVGEVVEVRPGDEATTSDPPAHGADWINVVVSENAQGFVITCDEHGEINSADNDRDEAHLCAQKHVDIIHGGQATVVEAVAAAS